MENPNSLKLRNTKKILFKFLRFLFSFSTIFNNLKLFFKFPWKYCFKDTEKRSSIYKAKIKFIFLR